MDGKGGEGGDAILSSSVGIVPLSLVKLVDLVWALSLSNGLSRSRRRDIVDGGGDVSNQFCRLIVGIGDLSNEFSL